MRTMIRMRMMRRTRDCVLAKNASLRTVYGERKGGCERQKRDEKMPKWLLRPMRLKVVLRALHNHLGAS